MLKKKKRAIIRPGGGPASVQSRTHNVAVRMGGELAEA